MKTLCACTIAAAALISGTGCHHSAPETPKLKLQLGVPAGTRKYQKLNAQNLYLELMSKPVLTAGSKATLTFAIRNAGERSITIAEWLRHEPDNLKLMLQPYLPGMTAPDPDGWIELSEPRKRPVMHYPLILMPDNQAIVTKELEFITKMRITPGMERRFFLMAQTTIASLELKSEVIVLKIIPEKKSKEKK